MRSKKMKEGLLLISENSREEQLNNIHNQLGSKSTQIITNSIHGSDAAISIPQSRKGIGMNNGMIPWVKKLGQAHIAKNNESETLCGMPMLGNNYAGVIPMNHQTPCEDCYSKIKGDIV